MADPRPYDGRLTAPHADRPVTHTHDDQWSVYDRPAAADEVVAYEDRFSAYNGRPTVFSPVVRPALRPLAPRTRRARGRAVLHWLAIAACVLIVCALLAGWLAWPESARLVGRWLAAEQSGGTAHAHTVIAAPQSAAQS